MAVQKLSNVRNTRRLPRVHGPMHAIKVWDTPMRDRQHCDDVSRVPLEFVWDGWQFPRGPAVAQEDFNASGTERAHSRLECVVNELTARRIGCV